MHGVTWKKKKNTFDRGEAPEEGGGLGGPRSNGHGTVRFSLNGPTGRSPPATPPFCFLSFITKQFRRENYKAVRVFRGTANGEETARADGKYLKSLNPLPARSANVFYRYI